MSRYRIVYSRGSFGLVTLCDSREKAVAEAHTLYRMSGVWHVHIEDTHGRCVACDHDLRAGWGTRAAAGSVMSCA
jgi:hypothetical protein